MFLDVATGEIVRKWDSSTPGYSFEDFVFSPDGREMAVLRKAYSPYRGLGASFFAAMGHPGHVTTWVLDVHDLETGTVVRSEVRNGEVDEGARLLWVR